MGRDGAVGITTRYGLDGPGIESRWGRDLPHPSRPALGPHPASYAMGTESFPGVKRPGRGVEHPPHLAPRLKSRAIALRPLWAFVFCSRVTFTFTFICDSRSGTVTGLQGLPDRCASQTVPWLSVSPHCAPRFRMSGVIPLLLLYTVMVGQGQLCFLFRVRLTFRAVTFLRELNNFLSSVCDLFYCKLFPPPSLLTH